MKKTRKLVFTAMFGAISALLMILEFSIPIFPSFIKMDFSDMPALIASFAFGPISGILVELIKNMIKLILMGTHTGFVGEFANFIVGSSFVLSAGIVYKMNKSRKGALMGMAAGTLIMSVIGSVANYYVLIPVYSKFMPLEAIIALCSEIIPAVDSLEKVVIFSIFPFNILKGVILSFITFPIYKRISGFIKFSH